MTSLSIEPSDLSSADAQKLIRALNEELLGRYPEPGATNFHLEAAEVAPGRGAFLICRQAGRAIGCGAVRLLNQTTAELKRMYTVPPARGRGVGRAILGRLEAQARALGAQRLVLETGLRQDEAIGLYESCGFAHTPPFGEYVNSPLSVCMEKHLGSTLSDISR